MIRALSKLLKINTDEYVTYEGNFDFYIKPIIQGELPYHTSTITINCFKDKKSRNPILFTVKWYREINGKNYPLKDESGLTHNVTPYDIGTVIVAAVKPIDSESDFKGIAIAKFGPIELDYSLAPLLENHFLSCEGAFFVKILKLGDNFVDDQSDFSNKIFFERTKMTIIFSEKGGNGNFNDFCLDVIGTPGIRIRCDPFDTRVLRIFYRKGEEEPITQSILRDERGYVNRFEKSIGSSIWDEYSYNNNEDDESVKEPSERISIASDNFHMILESEEAVSGEDEVTELSIKFESRTLRDCFLISMRVMRLIRNVPFQRIVENFNTIVSRMWYPNNIGERSPDYIQACFVLESHKEILRRMLRINRSLILENDTLNENVDILEGDLEFSAREFTTLIQHLKKAGESVDKLDIMKNKLIDHSMKIDKIRGRSKTPTRKNSVELIKPKLTRKDQEKLKRLERQLESRKTLNKMLLTEIEKLKSEGRKLKEKKRSVLDMTFNEARPNRIERKRVNRSVLDGESEENEYLIGLEDNLKHKNEDYEKRISAAHQKIEKYELEEMERLDEIKKENKIFTKRIQIYEEVISDITEIMVKIRHGDEIPYIKEVNEAVAEITDGEIKKFSDLKIKRLYQYSSFISKKIDDMDNKVNMLEELDKDADKETEKLELENQRIKEQIKQKREEREKALENNKKNKKEMKKIQKEVREIIEKRRNHKYEGMTYQEKIELMEKKIKKLEEKNKELKEKKKKRDDAHGYKEKLNDSLSLSSEGDIKEKEEEEVVEDVLNKASKGEDGEEEEEEERKMKVCSSNPFFEENFEEEEVKPVHNAKDFNPFNPFADDFEVQEKVKEEESFNPFNPFADDFEEEKNVLVAEKKVERGIANHGVGDLSLSDEEGF